MPFGSRRFFTGRSINPAITTITFDSPQGAGSSQPKHYTSASVSGDTAGIVGQVAALAKTGDTILVMSNGGFENIHGRLLQALEAKVGVEHQPGH